MTWVITDYYNAPWRWFNSTGEISDEDLDCVDANRCLRQAFEKMYTLDFSGTTLSKMSFVGGYQLIGDKLCLFRAYNGGNERKNSRPGRWVFLGCIVDSKNFLESDLCALLQTGVFAEYGKTIIPADAPCPSGDVFPISAGTNDGIIITENRPFLTIQHTTENTKILKSEERPLPPIVQPQSPVSDENVGESKRPPTRAKQTSPTKRLKKNRTRIVVLTSLLFVFAVIIWVISYDAP